MDQFIEESIVINNNIVEISDNNVFRCSTCFQIPLISIVKINDRIEVNYSCECTLKENEKSSNIPLEQFLQIFRLITLNSSLCNICETSIGKGYVNKLFFCLPCKLIFCQTCIDFHKEYKPGHESIQTDLFDNYCFLHYEETIGYSLNSKVNICDKCLNLGYNKKDIEYIKDVIIKDNEFQKIEEDRGILEKYILTKIHKIQEKYVKMCEKNEKKELEQLYNNFYKINKDLLYTAIYVIDSYKLKHNNLNYVTIKNVKNICKFDITEFDDLKPLSEYKKYLKEHLILNIEKQNEKSTNKIKLSQVQLNDIFQIIDDEPTIILDEDKHNNYVPISITDDDSNYKYLISNLVCKKTISNNKSRVTSYILLLFDKRYALAIGKHIEICDSNTFEMKIKIEGHIVPITTLSQMKDIKKKLISGDILGNIKIWLIDVVKYECIGNIKTEKNEVVFKIVNSYNGNIICCNSYSIEIWTGDFPYENKFSKKSESQKEYLSILETQNKKLVSASNKGTLIFYNPDNLDEIKHINNIRCSSMNSLIEIPNNRIAIGTNRIIFIVKTEKMIIEKRIGIERSVISMNLLFDNTLIISDDEYSIHQYNIDNCVNLASIIHAHDSYILCMRQINSKTLITGSLNTANFWEFTK